MAPIAGAEKFPAIALRLAAVVFHLVQHLRGLWKCGDHQNGEGSKGRSDVGVVGCRGLAKLSIHRAIAATSRAMHAYTVDTARGLQRPLRHRDDSPTCLEYACL